MLDTLTLCCSVSGKGYTLLPSPDAGNPIQLYGGGYPLQPNGGYPPSLDKGCSLEYSPSGWMEVSPIGLDQGTPSHWAGWG